MFRRRLFISYQSGDRALAEEIAVGLRHAGYTVFFDISEIVSGAEYHARIEREIKKSHGLIFLASPAALEEGRYTLTELELARAKWKAPSGKVLTVLLHGVQPSDLPGYLKSVSMLTPVGDAAAEAINSARKLWPRRSWGQAAAYALAAAVLIAYVAIMSHGARCLAATEGDPRWCSKVCGVFNPAGNANEHLICTKPILAREDYALNEAYQQLKSMVASAPDQEALEVKTGIRLIEEQHEWASSQRDVECETDNRTLVPWNVSSRSEQVSCILRVTYYRARLLRRASVRLAQPPG